VSWPWYNILTNKEFLMKVYAVEISFDYEGSNLDSVWSTYEAAVKRATEILIEGDEGADLPAVDGANYSPSRYTATEWRCSYLQLAGVVEVTEMDVQG